MNKEERDALIEEKRNEIKRLQEEVKDLRCGSIRTLARNKIFVRFYCDRKTGEPKVFSNSTDWADVWNHIRELSTKIHLEKGHNEFWGGDYYETPKNKLKQDEMTEEQRKASAEFADEVISLYNKYVLKVNNPFWVNGKAYTVPIDCKAVEGLIESEEER